MRFDMHVHTYYSDGIFSPRKIVELAIERNLRGIAITDHDTVSGIEEAISQSRGFPNFSVIPGIEFSCLHNNEEVHILGYFVNYKSEELACVLSKLNNSRKQRSKRIVEKLNQFNINISIEEVEELGTDGFTGRFHIAKLLLEKAYVNSIEEAFERFLSRGGLAYVQRESLNVKDTIKLISKMNGISVLAHPGLLKNKETINYCIQMGIMGIESIHSKHSLIQSKEFNRLAKKYNLIATGGSDCHGRIIEGDLLLGQYYCNIDKIPEIKERI